MDTTAEVEDLTQDSPGVHLMPPTVFWACLIAGAVLEWLFPLQFPVLSVPVRVAVGGLLGGAGFAFMIAAHETFQRSGTAVPTNQPAACFVVRGSYRFSRNPMYVGGSAFFFGIGLIAGSLWILACYLPLALYLARYVVPREEAYLERRFGEEFRRYRRSVRRWV